MFDGSCVNMLNAGKHGRRTQERAEDNDSQKIRRLSGKIFHPFELQCCVGERQGEQD